MNDQAIQQPVRTAPSPDDGRTMDAVERQCAELARTARIAAANRGLAALWKSRPTWKHAWNEVFGGMGWNDPRTFNLKQMLLLPVAGLVILLMALSVPLLYGALWLRVLQGRSELKGRIRVLSRGCALPAPADRNIQALWNCCDLDDGEFTRDESLDLLGRWIELLYGKQVAANFDLRERTHAIEVRNARRNIEFFAQGGSIFFHTPVRILLGELCGELPEYGRGSE